MLMPKPGGEFVSTQFVTAYGGPVRGGNRSLAWLAMCQRQLDIEHPGARLVVIQSAFNSGVDASKGTHDEDVCYDVKIIGLSWREGEKFLRRMGAAAYYRHEPEFDLEHLHLAILPEGLPSSHPTVAQVLSAFARQGVKVGIYVPQQIVDYMSSPPKDGLSRGTGANDHGPDPTWHPSSILATVFDYAHDYQEQHMSLRADLRAVADKHDHTLAYVAKIAVNEAQKKPQGPARTVLLAGCARLLDKVQR